MPFSIAYATATGVIAISRDDSAEALIQAIEWLDQGHASVTMTDLETGMVFRAAEIRAAWDSAGRQERDAHGT